MNTTGDHPQLVPGHSPGGPCHNFEGRQRVEWAGSNPGGRYPGASGTAEIGRALAIADHWQETGLVSQRNCCPNSWVELQGLSACENRTFAVLHYWTAQRQQGFGFVASLSHDGIAGVVDAACGNDPTEWTASCACVNIMISCLKLKSPFPSAAAPPTTRPNAHLPPDPVLAATTHAGTHKRKRTHT